MVRLSRGAIAANAASIAEYLGLSAQDRADILFGIQEGFDFIAASFCRTAQDVMEIRRLLDEQLAQRSLEIIPVLEIGNPHLICDVVLKGAGVSFLPDFVTEKARRTGALVYLDIPEIQVTIWKQLLHHRDKWISPQIDSVLKFCMEKEFQK